RLTGVIQVKKKRIADLSDELNLPRSVLQESSAPRTVRCRHDMLPPEKLVVGECLVKIKSTASILLDWIAVRLQFDLIVAGLKGCKCQSHSSTSVSFLKIAVKPLVVVRLVEDHGHAIVDRRHNLVRVSRDNRARLDRLPFGVLPVFPQAGERER